MSDQLNNRLEVLWEGNNNEELEQLVLVQGLLQMLDDDEEEVNGEDINLEGNGEAANMDVNGEKVDLDVNGEVNLEVNGEKVNLKVKDETVIEVEEEMVMELEDEEEAEAEMEVEEAVMKEEDIIQAEEINPIDFLEVILETDKEGNQMEENFIKSPTIVEEDEVVKKIINEAAQKMYVTENEEQVQKVKKDDVPNVDVKKMEVQETGGTVRMVEMFPRPVSLQAPVRLCSGLLGTLLENASIIFCLVFFILLHGFSMACLAQIAKLIN